MSVCSLCIETGKFLNFAEFYGDKMDFSGFVNRTLLWWYFIFFLTYFLHGCLKKSARCSNFGGKFYF